MTWGRSAVAALVAILPGAVTAAPSGALIAAVCANCHAGGATEAGAIPAFDTLTGAEVAAALQRFRDDGTGATLMPRIARGLTEADIAALAAHLDAAAGAVP